MRIALVSTQRTSVPPRKSGSVELIVAQLASGLTRLGHEVTVFAPMDSRPEARLRSLLPTGYHHDESIWDWELAEFMQLGLVYESAAEFDVIHSHVYCYALPFARLVQTPTVHTFHICPTPDMVRYCRRDPTGSYVLISEFQRGFFEDLPIAGIVHNGIDTRSFPLGISPGTYLAYLGDLREDKGPLDAIRFAQRVGLPICLAGRETPWFREVVAPMVDGTNVMYVGELDHAGKGNLLSGALALFFSSTGLEACPLVVLEALACGTPVVALARGPIPELVNPGVTGFYADTLVELEGHVGGLSGLDRRRIREEAIERFDLRRMVDDYLRVFEEAIAQEDAER